MSVLQDNIEYTDEVKLYKDFYETFYDLNFPIYSMKKITSKKIHTRFVTGFNWISNHVLNSKNTYLSICNKFMIIKGKKAYNALENARSAKFFVVDIDSDYIMKKETAEKIVQAWKHLGLFDFCPYPSAIVHSGCGLHFYYLIDTIYFPKVEGQSKENYSRWLESKLNLFKDGAGMVRNAVKKALAETIPYMENLNRIEKLTVKSLKVDDSVIAGTQQIIRAPGSYNSNASQKCSLLELNKAKYTLGELLKDYRPKTKKLSKKVIKFSKSGIYTSEQTVALNRGRLKDMHKLVEIRKENGSLIGSRQNIMSNAAWILVNINYNLPEGEEIDELEELLEIGSKIGGKFSSPGYCIGKLRNIRTYHSKINMLSNETMINFLNISEEELQELATLSSNRELRREEKRKEKAARKEEAIKWYYENGKNKTKTAEKYGVNRKTITRWVQEGEAPGEINPNRKQIKVMQGKG